MLVLTRRVGENIRIGNDITVEIVRIKGGQAALGITAPLHISVHREEIYNRIKTEQEHAPGVECL